MFDVFLHHFWLHFGTLFASICMLLRTIFLFFSVLFRRGCPLDSLSLLAPLWSPFGSHLVPIWGPFAPFCLPFGRLWHAGAPLASVVSLLSLSSLNSPFFPRFPHLPLTFRIYILCAASRGPATTLNHVSLWLMAATDTNISRAIR
jgi:hypothetical protein